VTSPATSGSSAPTGSVAGPRLARQGVLLVLSSPSGAGKSTLARLLRERHPEIAVSVSVTTRAMRPGEVEGRDYHFISRDEFLRRRDAGDLLEWAEVHGNLYATPKGPVDTHVTAGRDVLFDIDWQGAQQLAARASVPVTRVFILPPSAATLKQRLETRAQDSAEVVARRLAGAADEMTHWAEYDYVIVNDDLALSLATLEAILIAERQRGTRQTGMATFVAGLIASRP
jgi:guanylate kinase